MKRFLTILQSQLKGLSLKGALKLAKASLLRNDPILIYEYDRSRTRPVATAVPIGLSIRRGSIDDLSRNLNRFSSIPWEFQCHLYDEVTDFFIAVSDQLEIQHISWIYYENDPNRFMKLGPTSAEIKYSLTMPEFRGRGIYPHVLQEIAAYLAKKRIDRLFICVNASNHASIRGIEKAGFCQTARIRLIKVMGLQISRQYEP